MGSEAMLQKYREGPVGHFTLGPTGVPNMGKYLGQWFLWSLIIPAVAAFLAGRVFGLDHAHARGAANWWARSRLSPTVSAPCRSRFG
jgi:hypothetical protein